MLTVTQVKRLDLYTLRFTFSAVLTATASDLLKIAAHTSVDSENPSVINAGGVGQSFIDFGFDNYFDDATPDWSTTSGSGINSASGALGNSSGTAVQPDDVHVINASTDGTNVTLTFDKEIDSLDEFDILEISGGSAPGTSFDIVEVAGVDVTLLFSDVTAGNWQGTLTIPQALHPINGGDVVAPFGGYIDTASWTTPPPAPAPVDDLSVEDGQTTSTTITVAFTQPGGIVTGFDLEMSQSNSDWSGATVFVVSPQVEGIVLEIAVGDPLTPGTTYYFRVRTNGAATNSAWSDTVSATTQSNPASGRAGRLCAAVNIPGTIQIGGEL